MQILKEELLHQVDWHQDRRRAVFLAVLWGWKSLFLGHLHVENATIYMVGIRNNHIEREDGS